MVGGFSQIQSQIFCKKSIIKNRTIYWIPTGYNIPMIKPQYSQQYINYTFVRIIYITVVYCV